MDEQKQDNQLEQQLCADAAFKTYREQCTIEMGGERGLGKSVLVAQQDDDDNFVKAPGLEPHHQFSIISKTLIGEGSYPSAEMQSAYSTVPTNWNSIWIRCAIRKREREKNVKGERRWDNV